MELDPSLFGFSGVRDVLNVHPFFVHVPVALFPVALLCYGLGIVGRWKNGLIAGRICVWLATVGAALAILTGLRAEETIPHNAQIHHLMETHESLGLIIGGVGLGLAIWSLFHREQRPKMAWAFLGALTIVTGLVAQTSDLGARMVYIEGAGVKAAIPLVTGGRHHHAHEHEEAPDEHSPSHHDE